MLRLFTGVVLELVIFDFTGVVVLATEAFSGSESEFWFFGRLDVSYSQVLSNQAFPFDFHPVFLSNQT